MTDFLLFMARLALAALFLAAVPASACPSALPAGLVATAVGQGMVVDGMPLSVVQVQGRTAAATVLDRVEADWRAAGHDVRRTQAAGWQIVAARDAAAHGVAAGDVACLSTLQLTNRGGAYGYFAIKRPGRSSAPGKGHLPVPPGTTVLTTVASMDDGRTGTIAALTSPRTLEQMHAYYLQRLNDDKWQAVSSQVSLDRNRTPIGALVSARRGRERIEVVLWRDDGRRAATRAATHVVINLADAL